MVCILRDAIGTGSNETGGVFPSAKSPQWASLSSFILMIYIHYYNIHERPIKMISLGFDVACIADGRFPGN